MFVPESHMQLLIFQGSDDIHVMWVARISGKKNINSDHKQICR